MYFDYLLYLLSEILLLHFFYPRSLFRFIWIDIFTDIFVSSHQFIVIPLYLKPTFWRDQMRKVLKYFCWLSFGIAFKVSMLKFEEKVVEKFLSLFPDWSFWSRVHEWVWIFMNTSSARVCSVQGIKRVS